MKQLEMLIDRVISRVNINLREFNFDVKPYIRDTVPTDQLIKFYAFYGITSHHPIYFHFRHSNMAGTYFLGKCMVDNSVLYKSDVRGDELKEQGDVLHYEGMEIPLNKDQEIRVRDSFLIKTLVHCYPHDPENLDLFLIKRSVSTPYANIHGSPLDGCFLGPFSTVDLTTLHDCVIGTYAYVQAGELSHKQIEPGQIWVRNGNVFDFSFRFSKEVLDKYISFEAGKGVQGILMDFVEERETDFERLFDTVHLEAVPVPVGASLSRYAVLKPKSKIGENVLVAQRAYLKNAWMGKGANAQENCYIIHSRLEGYNVMAHGAKVIHAKLGKKTFAGFNAFLRGKLEAPLSIGKESIIMPHTIIDLDEPLDIPPAHLVWGYIRNQDDLEKHSVSFEKLSEIEGEFVLGNMRFRGNGRQFVESFQNRIEHILTDNGAYFDGEEKRGHAQKGQNISFNIIQPYPRGELEGLYPAMDINP
ncbi:transferase [Desulfonema magnum]|uniref:Acyltransferase n=1 Tax=Desulfonema magnum TaxID=45655 RepID=A0A975BW13_9BACT|nr:transferase [Desulfonema magnum]QTA92796.1 Putative acyltransferase [Desulfonema magnum]